MLLYFVRMGTKSNTAVQPCGPGMESQDLWDHEGKTLGASLHPPGTEWGSSTPKSVWLWQVPQWRGWPCEVTVARRQGWSPGCPPVLFPGQGRSRLQAAGRRMGRDKKEEPPDQRPQLMAVPRAHAPAASGPETPSGGPARASYARRKAASEHV